MDYLNKIDLSRLSRNFKEQPWKKRIDKPVREDFEYLYKELNLSNEEVMDFFGISQSTLSHIIRELGIKKTRKQIRESRAQIFTERFGSASPLGNKEVRNKRKQTCEERYGTEHPMQNKEVLKRAVETNRERYGCDYHMQTDEYKEYMCENNPMNDEVLGEEIREKIRESNRKRYGVDYAGQSEEVKEKMRKTNLERYGVEYAGQSEEVKKKAKETNLEKYGVEYASQAEEIKERVKKTNIEKYGAECVFQSEEIKDRIKKTNLEKYGVNNFNKMHFRHKENINKEFWEEHFIDKKLNAFCVSDCAIYHNMRNITVRTYMEEFGINVRLKYSSVSETEIATLCVNNGIEVKMHDRTLLAPSELDIVLPKNNIAIEFDGLMYHSAGYNSTVHSHTGINKDYHLNKILKCEKLGIRLFHVFEHEWLKTPKREVWKSLILKAVKKKYPKSTVKEVKPIDMETALAFLTENSLINSYDRFEKAYAAYNKDGEPVAVLVTEGDKGRYVESTKYRVGALVRLVRFAKISTVVLDRRYETEADYNLEEFGFTVSQANEPSLYYVNKTFTDNLSEEAENAYDREIYDCGEVEYKW